MNDPFDNSSTIPDPDPFGLGRLDPVEDPFGLGPTANAINGGSDSPFELALDLASEGATLPDTRPIHEAATQPAATLPATRPTSRPTTQKASARKRMTLKISFLEANLNHADKGFYDGKDDIDSGAEKYFYSLSHEEAFEYVTNHFREEPPPHDLRITGYSWGGWTALILAHDLGANYQIRMGLIDPVDTLRSQRHTELRQVPGRHGFSPVEIGPDFATKPANVVAGAEWYETIGLGGIIGGAFTGTPVSGFELHDVTSDCQKNIAINSPHIYICMHYAKDAIHFAFSDNK